MFFFFFWRISIEASRAIFKHERFVGFFLLLFFFYYSLFSYYFPPLHGFFQWRIVFDFFDFDLMEIKWMQWKKK